MQEKRTAGVMAALASALFLGVSPVLGKMAITFGMNPLAVVALRTSLATTLLFLIIVIFYRRFLYIFPVGLVGCILAGVINGLGSLLYYLALSHLSASLGQLLYSLYPFFVAFWLLLDHQPPRRITMIRTCIAAVAVLLLTAAPKSIADPIGVLMMLGAALLYAMHLPINQRVLYEVPPPTVTFYTLLAMSAVVVPAFFLFDQAWNTSNVTWIPILGLTFATLFSRLSLFLGVQRIGGMQTALLGLAELLVTIFLSYYWLNERLLPHQWLGVVILAASLLMVRLEPDIPLKRGRTGWLAWIRPPTLPNEIWPPYE